MVGRERPRSAARMPKTNGAAGGYSSTLKQHPDILTTLEITPVIFY